MKNVKCSTTISIIDIYRTHHLNGAVLMIPENKLCRYFTQKLSTKKWIEKVSKNLAIRNLLK